MLNIPHLLWAMEYFNERVFAFLESYAESGILRALRLKQSKHTKQSLTRLQSFN